MVEGIGEPCRHPAVAGWAFRRRSWLGRLGGSGLFAWAVSLTLHGAVFLGFYAMVSRERPGPRVLIIPEARLVRLAGPAGGVEASPAPVPVRPPASPPVLAQFPIPVLPDLPAAMSAAGDRLSIVALPAGGAPADGASVAAAAVGPFTRTDAGGAGPARAVTGTGPVSSFFGQTGNAYKVVYVVDLSASLMIYIDEIVQEMRQSIRDLLPTQRFHIVLAKPVEIQEFGPRRLVPAIGSYKREAMAFLDAVSGIPKPGKADPIEAMRRAFAAGPELIYFLTDGDYPDIQADLERTLGELNARREVHITTIGFGPSPQPRALLERIARTHGGHFRAVEPKG